MSSLIRYGVVMMGALALVGCEAKKQEAAPAPSAAPVADDQIATSADFEDNAAQEINETNAEQELAKLEQEVSAE
jgi:PBP1b-binding outer membrane lipoprotein LpoB